jgi:hypothetical protein
MRYQFVTWPGTSEKGIRDVGTKRDERVKHTRYDINCWYWAGGTPLGGGPGGIPYGGAPGAPGGPSGRDWACCNNAIIFGGRPLAPAPVEAGGGVGGTPAYVEGGGMEPGYGGMPPGGGCE